MRRSALAIIGAITALAFGCVTINIYFPAAAAERAADRIIDEVWQLKPESADSQRNKPASPR